MSKKGSVTIYRVDQIDQSRLNPEEAEEFQSLMDHIESGRSIPPFATPLSSILDHFDAMKIISIGDQRLTK
jgi:hypothetical protein